MDSAESDADAAYADEERAWLEYEEAKEKKFKETLAIEISPEPLMDP